RRLQLDEQQHAAELAAGAEATIQEEARELADALEKLGVVHAAPLAPPVDDVPPRLVVAGVRAAYGDVDVLHGVDLELGPGRILALLGANGGGKSTLCNVIAGGLVPKAGVVLLDGEDITSMPAHRRV